MICPSLPQTDYPRFTQEMFDAIRADKCEHVWAEVINVRGESMVRTVAALRNAGFVSEASQLQAVSRNRELWEEYARCTFFAHAEIYPPGKLRFLQYVTNETREWWEKRRYKGAVLL
jgi:hypothetical protein